MRSRNVRVANVAGVLTAGDSARGRLDSANPEKLYRIQLRQFSSLNLSLSGLQANANLELLNHQGKLLSRSTQPGRSREAIRQDVDPGTYYVRVFRQQGTTRYQLRLKQSSFPVNPIKIPLTIPQAPDPIVQSVINITNQYRARAGVSPLRWNAVLSGVALTHSQDMAYNDFFSHTGSDRSSVFTRLQAAGYRHTNAGENIAAGFSTPEEVVRAWMQSPPHKAVLLEPSFTEIGIGFFLLDQDPGTVQANYYWTQNFGTPS